MSGLQDKNGSVRAGKNLIKALKKIILHASFWLKRWL
jgi:hypothetical protein